MIYFSALKKSEADYLKRLEMKTDEFEKTKEEYRLFKDQVTEKDKMLQGTYLKILTLHIFIHPSKTGHIMVYHCLSDKNTFTNFYETLVNFTYLFT